MVRRAEACHTVSRTTKTNMQLSNKIQTFFLPFFLFFYSLFCFFFFFFAKYYVFHFGFAAKHSKCICHSSCNWSWIWVAILSTGWVPLLSARADNGEGGRRCHCRVLSRKRGFLIATWGEVCVGVFAGIANANLDTCFVRCCMPHPVAARACVFATYQTST